MTAIKKVLIPTDFSIRSLKVLLDYLKNTDQKLDVTLVHGYESSNSIMDLLFDSKTKKLQRLQTNEFQESCKLIQNTYNSKINSIKIDVIPFATRRYFNNYIEANKFDLLICPEGFKSNYSKGSFDLMPFIIKSKFNKEVVDFNPTIPMEVQPTGQVADLFMYNVK